MTPSSEKTAPKLTRILTFSIFVKKYKIAHNKSQLSQHPSMLGIKIVGVLKSENQAKQLLFLAHTEKNSVTFLFYFCVI